MRTLKWYWLWPFTVCVAGLVLSMGNGFARSYNRDHDLRRVPGRPASMYHRIMTPALVTSEASTFAIRSSFIHAHRLSFLCLIKINDPRNLQKEATPIPVARRTSQKRSPVPLLLAWAKRDENPAHASTRMMAIQSNTDNNIMEGDKKGLRKDKAHVQCGGVAR